MEKNIFKGLITAIITPFKNNKLDLEALEKIIEHQIKERVDAILVAGSTGEGTSLTFEEYELLVQTSVKIVNKRIPVIGVCSSNNTEYAVKLVLSCDKACLDGFMISPPAYVKPTQTGIYEHIKLVHNSCELPIMLYSVPSRTGVDFTDETIYKLSKLPRIIALKDAGIDLEKPLRIKALIQKNFNLLCGNDDLSLAYNAQGGIGCVSVASNIAPALCKKLQDKWHVGDVKNALEIHLKLLPLYKALFTQSNPIPVKYAAYYLGLCEGEIRLPLTKANDNTKKQIEEIITSLSIKL